MQGLSCTCIYTLACPEQCFARKVPLCSVLCQTKNKTLGSRCLLFSFGPLCGGAVCSGSYHPWCCLPFDGGGTPSKGRFKRQLLVPFVGFHHPSRGARCLKASRTPPSPPGVIKGTLTFVFVFFVFFRFRIFQTSLKQGRDFDSGVRFSELAMSIW